MGKSVSSFAAGTSRMYFLDFLTDLRCANLPRYRDEYELRYAYIFRDGMIKTASHLHDIHKLFISMCITLRQEFMFAHKQERENEFRNDNLYRLITRACAKNV